MNAIIALSGKRVIGSKNTNVKEKVIIMVYLMSCWPRIVK